MKKLFAAVIFLLAASYAPAQTPATPPAAPAADPVATSVRILLPRQQKNTLAAIDAMPADKFGYKPTPDQMSFAHLVVHITEFNNSMCSKIADVPAPKTDELKETDGKDKLQAAAKASFDFCGTTLASLNDSKMGDMMDFFGRFQAPRAMAALILASGWADHYGSAAMYLRLNNILPPTAQPKK
jgi:DinB superfamily